MPLHQASQLVGTDTWLLLQGCCLRCKHLHGPTNAVVEQHNRLHTQAIAAALEALDKAKHHSTNEVMDTTKGSL